MIILICSQSPKRSKIKRFHGRKKSNDDHSVKGTENPLKACWEKCAKSMFYQANREQAIVDDLYIESIWLLQCPTTNRWKRKARKRRNMWRRLSFIKHTSSRPLLSIDLLPQLTWCIFYHHPIKVQHMIPDNIDPPDDAFVICQVTRPLFYFFFLQLWFNWTLLGHVKSSEPFFFLNFVTHTQSKLYRPHSIQIQNGWCLTSLMVSEAPLGITLLLTSLSDELLNPPLRQRSFFPLYKKP